VHPAWVNLDLVALVPGVIPHDLRRGLPFPDGAFDVVYSSHVMEHLTPEDALQLLREARRVMRLGGTLRLAVPDLQGIARAYLEALARAERGESGGDADHTWMVLELVDQMVRTKPGGAMAAFLQRKPFPNRDFVLGRFGREAEALWENGGRVRVRRTPNLKALIRRIRYAFASGAVGILAGRRALATFRDANFRTWGEVHRWMYDRYSLGRLMETAGFVEVHAVGPEESRVPGFPSYQLDSEGGRARKPDSLYMEGVKE